MSKIIENEQELDEIIKEGKGAIVLFYASWCPFSQEFLPIFEKYAKGNSCRVLTDEIETCEDKYSIDVVPTVLFFKNGKVVKRLDGEHGRGLNEEQLVEMINSCGLKK